MVFKEQKCRDTYINGVHIYIEGLLPVLYKTDLRYLILLCTIVNKQNKVNEVSSHERSILILPDTTKTPLKLFSCKFIDNQKYNCSFCMIFLYYVISIHRFYFTPTITYLLRYISMTVQR